MSEDLKTTEERRQFLKLVGGGAVLMPIMSLAACSGGSDKAPAAAAPKTDKAPAADASPKPSGMPQLAEDDPQAKSLSYVHDATTIDTAKQPRYKAGQLCSNCALYQGRAGDEWAACSIFPGKAVKASGWCSVYSPKPG